MRVSPIGPDEFAGLMAALEPFAPGRPVLAAVSGGADSMALAYLLRGWGDPLAVIVDHGLRPGSAAEAALTADRLRAIGVPSRVTRIALQAGPGLGERARAGRYAALLAACQAEGRPDLVIAHHESDQAETQALRKAGSSGPAGMAGIPALSFRGAARLLRPLLGVAPGRLRATLRAAGIAWAEDPGNRDPATARGALRQAPPPSPDLHPAQARAALEAALARELAYKVTLYPFGAARIAAPLTGPAWSALVWTLSGRSHPPATRAVRHLASTGRGTLHGVLVRDGWAMRESGSTPDPRFAWAEADAAAAPLGADAGPFRGRAGLPGPVLRRLPTLRVDGNLSSIPHLDFPSVESCRSVQLGFRPERPLAGAAFVPAARHSWPGDAHTASTHHVDVDRGGTASGLEWGPLGSDDEQLRT